MKEPLATRVVSGVAFALLVGALSGFVYLMLWLQSGHHIIQMVVLAAVFIATKIAMLCLSRMEYGEWSQGVPWWERQRIPLDNEATQILNQIQEGPDRYR